jgi:hypothetical protein
MPNAKRGARGVNIVEPNRNRAHTSCMGILTFFRSGDSEPAFEPPDEGLSDLPAQFTVDELSSELLNLLLKSTKSMAQIAIFASRAVSTEERNHVIEECLIFYWWYLEELIDGRKVILEGVHKGFGEFLWDLEAIREQVGHYESKSLLRHQQYGRILREAGGGARLAENVAPILVENILCDGEWRVSLFSVQVSMIDCIQTFGRLVFQALSTPMKCRPYG